MSLDLDRAGLGHAAGGHRAQPVKVMVTRPEPEAKAWAQALQDRGIACDTLPLITITALPDPSVLERAWTSVSEHWAVMFVSANAVRFWMAARPAGQAMPSCRAWSTGPGTKAALLAVGWPPDLIDSPPVEAAQFDSEALWSLVAHQVGAGLSPQPCQGSVLIVRGADAQGHVAGRDWLARQLEQIGVQVCQVAAYVRQVPQWDVVHRQRVQQAITEGVWWLFSSSEAAQHLLQACPDLPWAHARALATHPRIAERLQAQGWGQVKTVPASLEAQAVSIKSCT